MSTYTLKAKDVGETWHVVDASGQALGRLASQVAATLRGKNRPTFTPSMGNGDFVIVVNAAKVKISGDMSEKKYWRHSQYPGGLKSISQDKLLATRPERVIEYAVKGMLPHNSHGAKLLRHLKVYAGPHHPHQAQVNAGKGKVATTESATETSPRPRTAASAPPPAAAADESPPAETSEPVVVEETAVDAPPTVEERTTDEAAEPANTTE